MYSFMKNMILWISIQISIIVGLYYYYNNLKEYRCTCKKYKIPFPLAKASAGLINLFNSLTLISIVRFPKLFFYIPFKIKYLHIYCSISLFIWSVVHSISHYTTFIKFKYPLFTSGIGITGHILLLLLITISISSLPYFRKFLYQTFLYFHYTCFIVYIIILFIHGNFCFIKNDNGECPQATSWFWLSMPLLYIMTYTLYKSKNKFKIIKFLNCGNNIVKLYINLDKSYMGKSIWICCPNVNTGITKYLEWHPFTVCMYNDSNCCIYFKIRGDWTRKFYNTLYIEKNNIDIIVEGGYQALPKNIVSIISKKQVVLISTGIGITAFVNLFHQLLDNIYIYNLHIILVVRYEQEIDWLLDLITELYKKNNINISLFFTGEKYNYLLKYIEIPYKIGRPQLNDIFKYNTVKNEKTDIYYSGRTRIGRNINKICSTVKNYNFYYVN